MLGLGDYILKNEFVAAGIPSDEVDLMKALSFEEIVKCVKEGMKTPNKLDEAQYVELFFSIYSDDNNKLHAGTCRSGDNESDSDTQEPSHKSSRFHFCLMLT